MIENDTRFGFKIKRVILNFGPECKFLIDLAEGK